MNKSMLRANRCSAGSHKPGALGSTPRPATNAPRNGGDYDVISPPSSVSVDGPVPRIVDHLGRPVRRAIGFTR